MDDIDGYHGPIYITVLLSLFLIVIHIIFSGKKIFSQFSILPRVKMTTTAKPNKIIVFDLDETLGCFTELSIFWEALEQFYGNNLFNDTFYELVDIFPEFLRPNIIDILEYLKDKKINNECDKIMIYTNNQGHKSWVTMISNYFNNKISYKIFDNIIAAFKIRGKIVEFNRTSHDKSVEDLIRCTRISPHTEICFIDDQYHPLMNLANVYYINVKPYFYSMPFNEMAERYYQHNAEKLNCKKEDFLDSILSCMNNFNYSIKNKSNAESEIDKIISKQIVIHLEKFFKKKSQPTRKRKNIKLRSTRRKL